MFTLYVMGNIRNCPQKNIMLPISSYLYLFNYNVTVVTCIEQFQSVHFESLLSITCKRNSGTIN